MLADVRELMKYENALLSQGYNLICGVDEVGRGPLAGPVTCTAIIMSLNDLIEGVNDSKKVSKKNRQILYSTITERAIAVSTISCDNRKIDEINILNATKLCMKEAVMSLSVKPDIVLVDAVKLDLPYKTLSIIHGDELSYSIAAASIVAKVTRDAYMSSLAPAYPEYGFDNNKGYGTAQHIAALKQFGATDIHRKSFIGGILTQ